MKGLRKLAVSACLLFSLITFGLLLTPKSALAAPTAANCQRQSNNFLSFPTWYKYLDFKFDAGGEGRPPGCNITFEFPGDISKVFLALFEIVLRVAGIIAVVFIIFGGFQYLTSQGEPDKAKSARTTLANAIVGLLIALLAVAIVNLIANNIP